MSKHIPSKTITTLKQDAKKLKLKEGITQSEALEEIANQEGFKSWGLLLKAIKENKVTSFNQLWEMIMEPSVTLIGGRPAMGKTTLALAFALKAAQSRDVLYFSYEMLANELSMRMLSLESGVDTNKIKRKNFKDSDLRKIGTATKRLSTLPIHINDSAEIVIAKIKEQIKEKIDKKPCVLIDYLQLMPPIEKKDNRENQLKALVEELRAISKELGVPVIVLSQLTRAIDARVDKRPQKEDLRTYCPSLPCLVDQVVFVYRDRYYDPDSSYSGAELIIPQHRNYQNSILKIDYDEKIGKFIL